MTLKIEGIENKKRIGNESLIDYIKLKLDNNNNNHGGDLGTCLLRLIV